MASSYVCVVGMWAVAHLFLVYATFLHLHVVKKKKKKNEQRTRNEYL